MDAEKSNQQNQLLTEVPPTLQQLLLTLVKIFYGIECYVIFCYIQKKIILKEEELRQVCKIDQRQLRKFLVTLKVEKFIKERLVPQEVDGKVRKFTYYFVNYKGALNVAKYKIDHIRQKLEVREKDDIHRAFYRCSNEGCKRQYDVMDMGKIFDPFTQEMRCWQCHSLVEQDELASGPSSTTRSSMAKFNEQMTGIFSLLKQMDGIRFGREITEPTIQAPIFKSEGETIELETRKVASLGQRAFFGAGKTRSDLYGGDITVSIGDDNIEKTLEAKAEIPWLLSAKQVDVDST
uniref:Transcription initiation factor IIE subunit alpha N-terminal domain-containing protein n=1 Tax=Meloidogyne floridensis TaxID=298350 RepID=A0A915NDJ7_9BILA